MQNSWMAARIDIRMWRDGRERSRQLGACTQQQEHYSLITSHWSASIHFCVLYALVLQVDLFSYSRVFIPVHVHGNHWCLGCVNVTDRRLEYFDSLGGNNPIFFSTLRSYLADEFRSRHPDSQLDFDSWTDFCPKQIPRQDNGSDCGVFTLKFADYLSHSPPLPLTSSPASRSVSPAFHFTAADMDYFRHRIALEIKQQTIL
jgi:sentrin-specific protease 1